MTCVGTAAIELLEASIAMGKKVVASLAPSFPAAFPEVSAPQVVAGLKALGFSCVEETARALIHLRSAVHKMQPGQRPVISSSCPRVVELVSRELPEALPFLCPFPSPMMLHCSMLRQEWGNGSVIAFIGPCNAKGREAHPAGTGPDALVTFAQLRDWFRRRGITLRELREGSLSGEVPAWARLAVLVEGVNGLERCRRFIEQLLEKGSAGYHEVLACEGGCLGGPGMGTTLPMVERRQAVLKWVERNPS
ncbi:MAG: [Fe-Fe] hydrogenase large subunit C-terminal domain-containing protein [Bacillota bacterium]